MAAILPDTQALTVELFEREFELFTSLLVERLEECFETTFTSKFNGENDNNVVITSQKLTNIERVNQEDGKIICFKAPEEKGLDVFQNEKELPTGLKEIDQERLRKTFLVPEVSQAIAKVPQGVGIFTLTRKMRKGTLQFLYNNGLSILIKELCVLRGFISRRRQPFKIRKFQMKIQEYEKRKKKGGGTRIRKWSKKARRKWRWKNDNLFPAGEKGEVENGDGRIMIYYPG